MRTLYLYGLLVCALLGACAQAPRMQYGAWELKRVPKAGSKVPGYVWIGPNSEPIGSFKFHLRASTITIADPTKSKQPDPKNAARDALATLFGGLSDYLAFRNTREILDALASNEPVKKLADLKRAKAVISPLESPEYLFAMVPLETYLMRPNPTVKYLANTRLLSSVGAETEDYTVDFLKVIGGANVLSAAAGVAATPTVKSIEAKEKLDPNALHYPIIIDLERIDHGAWVPIQDTWSYRVLVDAYYPGDSFESFFGIAYDPSSKDTRIIKKLDPTRRVPVTPCQRIRLQITDGKEKNVEKLPFWDVEIAVPDKVEWINLPGKGTITFHPVCGADVASTKSSGSSGVDMLQAIIDQIKAERDAKKKK